MVQIGRVIPSLRAVTLTQTYSNNSNATPNPPISSAERAPRSTQSRLQGTRLTDPRGPERTYEGVRNSRPTLCEAMRTFGDVRRSWVAGAYLTIRR